MLDRATTTPSISCVMPAYNEAGNLGRFVPQVLEALRALSPQVEVVIVNDGSRDQTAAAAIELTRQHPEVVLIDLSRNFGKEAALTAGMEAARGEVVILMDSDGQHPVSLMAQMLQRWREGMDVVYAVRKTRDDQTRLHANLAGLFYTLVNHNNRVKIPPNAGDFRLMDRAVVEAIKTLPERNRFMKGLYAPATHRWPEQLRPAQRRLAGPDGSGGVLVIALAGPGGDRAADFAGLAQLRPVGGGVVLCVRHRCAGLRHAGRRHDVAQRHTDLVDWCAGRVHRTYLRRSEAPPHLPDEGQTRPGAAAPSPGLNDVQSDGLMTT